MALNWNTGGWFGSQIGATAWMLLAAMMAIFNDASTGLTLLLIFAIPNVAGYILWRRKTLSCYASTQVLLALTGVCAMLTIYTLSRTGLWLDIQSGSSMSVTTSYLVIGLMYGGLMLMFYWRFGRREIS